MKKKLAKVSKFFSKEHVEKYYTVKDKLGSGSFSVVKLGINKKTGEEFAIKIIEKKRVGEKKMMQTEIDILNQVHHPNVIQLREMFETSTHLYLVMELVTGGELFDRIVAQGSFNEKEASYVSKQLLGGVAYLHSIGIVHRDLKPENLLCTTRDSLDIKITDFGLSKILSAEAVSMFTACGTPSYVAPEVLKCEGYDKSVDLWSAGVICYIILCGFPPFHHENNAQLFELIMSGKFGFPDPYWSSVSPQAKDFVKRLLSVDTHSRMTAEQGLKHVWITGEVRPNLLSSGTIRSLRDYNQSRREENKRNAVEIDEGLSGDGSAN
jgi:serine/threonine protein kinase